MVSMRFEGGQELAKVLASLPTRVSRSVQREALFAVAEPMRARMARLAPREPGAPDIADNIVVSGGRGGKDKFGDEKAISVAIGPAKGFFYGFYQEYGTARHGAQPFARPAFDGEVPKIPAALAQALWIELAGKGFGFRSGTGSGPVVGGPGGGTL